MSNFSLMGCIGDAVARDHMKNRGLARGSGSISRDYLGTAMVSMAAVAESFAGYRIAASRFGPDGFVQFSMGIRVLAVLQPALLIGAAVSLPRFVARLPKRVGLEADEYLAAALIPISAVLVLLNIVALAFQGPIARVIFGPYSDADGWLVGSVAFLITGSTIQMAVFAFLRGQLKVAKANMLLLTTLVAVPLAAVLFLRSPSRAFYFWGGAMIVAASLTGARPRICGRRSLRIRLSELLAFGLRRIPGELALFGLFALPPLFVTHTGDPGRVGATVLGVAIVSGVGSLFSPLSLVLLPRASAMFGSGRNAEVVHQARSIGGRVLFGSIVLAGGMILAAEAVLRLLLGPAYVEAAGSLRVLCIAIPGYVGYVSLRGVIDAYHLRAVNMRNAFVAFMVCAGGSWIPWWHQRHVYEIAFVLGVATLAGLTLRELARIHRDGIVSAPGSSAGPQSWSGT